MPKQGLMVSEKESHMVIRTINIVQKRLEKLKGKFQGIGETERSVSTSKPRQRKSRKSTPAS